MKKRRIPRPLIALLLLGLAWIIFTPWLITYIMYSSKGWLMLAWLGIAFGTVTCYIIVDTRRKAQARQVSRDSIDYRLRF